ncbi:gene transfer agent family protein [Consotaella salsifontis]|uniref:Phage tail tube protein, GTA-gp10 n=1 Tax=Consotaella salsifontis TaxID=1365950 RepID=A0A1T4MEC3_9HYPH|nr:gene transfer agent family protein [Consotaella salsifontis]SJZ65207.1 Phage tail tube protein, GTA-gp10 [Consotaella salsifontis]
MKPAVNRRRGEVGAMIDGKAMTLCLTLGALAELEDAFASEDLSRLAARFSAGRLSAHDLVRILGAGLRGAGEPVSDAEVAAMRIEDGAAGAAKIAAELLSAAFGEAVPEPTSRP